jgi:hypothetical protein
MCFLILKALIRIRDKIIMMETKILLRIYATKLTKLSYILDVLLLLKETQRLDIFSISEISLTQEVSYCFLMTR